MCFCNISLIFWYSRNILLSSTGLHVHLFNTKRQIFPMLAIYKLVQDKFWCQYFEQDFGDFGKILPFPNICTKIFAVYVFSMILEISHLQTSTWQTLMSMFLAGFRRFQRNFAMSIIVFWTCFTFTVVCRPFLGDFNKIRHLQICVQI